jgi:cysteine desulfurase
LNIAHHTRNHRYNAFMDCIYLDNNATTPMLPAVWEAMRPYLSETYGNPASAHGVGRRARRALEDARDQVAALLGAAPEEVIFTSGGTEANNLAVFGLPGDPPGHVVASPIEHPSVAEPLRRLGETGFSLDYVPVDATGVVSAAAMVGLLRSETRLVTVMLANNETGAVQPIADLVGRCPGVPFHCDAVQAVGRMPLHFGKLGVTSLSLSAHKFHGPRGIGALLLQRRARMRPLLWGGHQQRARRPGTEPVALAVGLAVALDLAQRDFTARDARVRVLRARLLAALRTEAAPVVLNGPEDGGLPHTINLSFAGCRADVLLMSLDLAGVACSTGSACSSGSLLPSPVLQAMGVPNELLHSAMRFSLSALLTEAKIDEAARRIVALVRRLRAPPQPPG